MLANKLAPKRGKRRGKLEECPELGRATRIFLTSSLLKPEKHAFTQKNRSALFPGAFFGAILKFIRLINFIRLILAFFAHVDDEVKKIFGRISSGHRRRHL